MEENNKRGAKRDGYIKSFVEARSFYIGLAGAFALLCVVTIYSGSVLMAVPIIIGFGIYIADLIVEKEGQSPPVERLKYGLAVVGIFLGVVIAGFIDDLSEDARKRKDLATFLNGAIQELQKMRYDVNSMTLGCSFNYKKGARLRGGHLDPYELGSPISIEILLANYESLRLLSGYGLVYIPIENANLKTLIEKYNVGMDSVLGGQKLCDLLNDQIIHFQRVLRAESNSLSSVFGGEAAYTSVYEKRSDALQGVFQRFKVVNAPLL